jgi:hypothetical protein
VDGKNIVIMQGFNVYFGLRFFQGALLTDPKKVLVQSFLSSGWRLQFYGFGVFRQLDTALPNSIHATIRRRKTAERDIIAANHLFWGQGT